jgi:hypothetical protein
MPESLLKDTSREDRIIILQEEIRTLELQIKTTQESLKKFQLELKRLEKYDES